MPIPERLRFDPASQDVVERLRVLCNAIEEAVVAGEDTTELLAEWHVYATRTCEPHEFTSYWKAVDQEEFVREALSPRPTFVDDLAYAEALAVLRSIVEVELAESETSHYLEWLEHQFPGSRVCDLIYCPDEWFRDPTLFCNEDGSFQPEAELSNDQVLAYAMASSGRLLSDRPDGIAMPHPLPDWTRR